MVEFPSPHNTNRMVSCLPEYSESYLTALAAGYTYCAIASLHFLGRLPDPSNISYSDPRTSPNLINVPDIVHWLVSRQVGYRAVDDDDETVSRKQPDPSTEPLSLEQLSIQDSECVGFNGRCNKPVDTCYAFWVGASLDVYSPTTIQSSLANHTARSSAKAIS